MLQLSERAMLVSLSISQWTARKLDKQVTAKVISDNHASADSGRFNKALVSKEALQTIQQTATAARDYHYTVTLPWLDTGARILPAAMFDDYSRKMRSFRAEFDQAVARFLGDYSALVDDARIRLNGMFKAEDYPAADRIGGAFAFELKILPLPDAADFRVALSSDQLDTIRAEIERGTMEAQAGAVKDCWARLHRAVSAMADRLGDPEAIFRDTLVGNIRELVDILPKLNITEDPALAQMVAEVSDKLTGHEAQTLRTSPTLRARTVAEAQAILGAMGAFMGSAS